jgi:hypothetical protein
VVVAVLFINQDQVAEQAVQEVVARLAMAVLVEHQELLIQAVVVVVDKEVLVDQVDQV